MTPNDLDPVMTVFGPFERPGEAYWARMDEQVAFLHQLYKDRWGWLYDNLPIGIR